MTAPKEVWPERRRTLPLYLSARPPIRLLSGFRTVSPEAPRWFRWTESWFSSARRPVPLLLDTAVAYGVVWALTSSTRGAAQGAAAFAAASLALGLAKPRTSLEAQGVGWYCRPAILASAAVGLVLSAGGTRAGAAASAGAAVFLAGLLLRASVWQAIAAVRRRGVGLRPALVVASEGWADRIRHRMSIFPEAGLACVSVQPLPSPGEDQTRLAMAIERSGATNLVLAEADPAVVRRVVAFAGERLECSVVVPVRGAATRAHIGDIDLVPLRMRPPWGSMGVKRLLDVTLAVVFLVLLSPLLLVTALAIRLHDGGPAIFRQKRVGRDGCMFTCYKFRSMVVDAEHYRDGLESDNITGGLLFKLERDPRVTPVGRFIRRFSIDELPQLVNVLRGEMSLVGPRPLPVDPAEFSSDAQPRHAVPPGITGLWQVHGANAVGYPEMLDLDFSYITSRSVAVDLMLLARTVPALLIRRSPG
jgi:lipopolysaccharide/colanic/teichoic acid biosynthesis glycosyltransferase